MLRFTTSPKLKEDIAARIIVLSAKLPDIMSVIIREKQYADVSESPESVLEIARKFASSTDEIIISTKWRAPWSKVVGGYANGVIYINPKFINTSADDGYILGHLCHEAGHHFGFGHASKWNEKRKFNAVYTFGYLVRYLSKSKGSRTVKEFKQMMEEIK